MAGILDILNSDLGKQIINGVANSTGQESGKTGNVLTMALPVLMKAMQRNASTQEGAEGLMGALKKHDGNILDNLKDLFEGGVNEEVVTDGGKILNHVLGDKANGVEQILSNKSGIDTSNVANILKTAAPILMGVLGKQTNQQGVQNAEDISGVLGGLLGGNETQQEQSFLEKILDADGDGSIIDDVAGMVLGNNNQAQAGSTGTQQNTGGLLGGLLGKVFGR